MATTFHSQRRKKQKNVPPPKLPSYPGLGLDLRDLPDKPRGHRLNMFPIGMHNNNAGSHSAMLLVREVCMMQVMEDFTNKRGWENDAFDETMVIKWKAKLLRMDDQPLYDVVTAGRDMTKLKKPSRILSGEAIDYCIQELQNKAKYYQRSKIILTLDATSCVAKSDSLIGQETLQQLNQMITKLKGELNPELRWRSDSNEQVHDVVDPFLYPLIYGRSRVFRDSCVGVSNAVRMWSGKGDIIGYNQNVEQPPVRLGSSDIPWSYWSDKYQWLPFNLKIADDENVTITSYINNINPEKHGSMYKILEKYIDTIIPIWDQVLRVYEPGRGLLGPGRITSRYAAPEDIFGFSRDPWNDTDRKDDEREPVVPELEPFREINYSVTQSLRKKFKNHGLQIILRISSIELTPEQPEFPAGHWTVQGQMNERICATSIMCVESSNVTLGDVSFRQQVSYDATEDFQFEEDEFHHLEQLYGTSLGNVDGLEDTCLQNYGRVEMKTGRVVAFPNTLHSRVSSYRLQDDTKPGHAHMITLWLVDPHVQIISTAIVPPQQQHWWLQSVTSGSRTGATQIPAELLMKLEDYQDPNSSSKLPQEIVSMIDGQLSVEELPMSIREAKIHRLAMMGERERFGESTAQEWNSVSYNL